MHIVLDEATHTYKNILTDEVYTSVTQFLHKYKKPFDKEYWSQVVADRKGITKEAVQEAWAKIVKTATDKGTAYHKVMETYIKDKTYPSEYESLVKYFDKKMKGIVKNNSIIHSECLMFLDSDLLAGTADLIVENSDHFYILDFKTNKAFNFASKYNEYYYEPISHLPQCEFSTYSLQLSMYAYMKELESKKKCAGLKIFYLRDFGQAFWQEINCNYMRCSILNLLRDKREKEKNI